MKNKKFVLFLILIVLIITFTSVAYAAFGSSVTYEKTMTMPDDIRAMIGG